jgi:mannose/cellobiose epimerase-like protein (N-acyl-D-glucosamine 2-epimerase family)
LQQGIAILDKAVRELEAVDFWLSLPGHMAVLADAMRQAKRYRDAADVCERALRHIALSGERLHEPELKLVRAAVAADAKGHVDDSIREMLHSAVASAQELSLPFCEHRAWRTMRSYVGNDCLGAEGEQRLEELSALNDLEERAGRIIGASYPQTA